MSVSQPVRRTGRIEVLDMARAVALLAMLVYHFTWDLEFFGYLPSGTAVTGGWRLFARGIAISFLVLVGIGIHLAHADGIRWKPFRFRLAQIAAGAAIISLGTYILTPGSFVFFGILHQIAVGSVLALAFLRLPAMVTLLAALATVLLPLGLESPAFDTRWLAWIGFSQTEPLSNDFVPVFPWTACILFGLGVAQFAGPRGVFAWLARLNGRVARVSPLGRLGRHSLAFYLIHQPVSIALIAGFAQVFPPDQLARFGESCQASCIATADAAFCDRYCSCVERSLMEGDVLTRLLAQRGTDADQRRLTETVSTCSFDPDRP